MEILIRIWETLKAFFESSATGNLIQFAILVALIVGYVIITKPWQRRFVGLFQQRYESLINEVDFLIDEMDALRKHANLVYNRSKSQNDKIPYPPVPAIYRRKEEVEFLELPGSQPLRELRSLESRSEHLENLNILKSEWLSESQTHEIIIHFSQLVQFYGNLKSDQWILNNYILRVDYGDIEGFAHFKDTTRNPRDIRAKRDHIENRTIRQFYIMREGTNNNFHRNWNLLSFGDGKPSKGWKSIAYLQLKYDGDIQSETNSKKPRIITVFPAKENK